MTLTARETMQKLLAGKTLHDKYGGLYRLNKHGVLERQMDSGTPWREMDFLNNIEGVGEKYPLTFEKAMYAMLSGRTVEAEFSQDLYKFRNSDFMTKSEPNEEWETIEFIGRHNRLNKWRVIE